MPLNPSIMKDIVSQLYIIDVEKSFGRDGIVALKFLLRKLHEVYGYFDPGTFQAKLYIIVQVNNIDNRLNDIPNQVHCKSIETMVQELSPQSRTTNSAIFIKQNGQMILWKDFEVDIDAFSHQCIIYEYCDYSEMLIVKGDRLSVPNPASENTPSVFAVPTFTSLNKALEDYKTHSVRYSKCRIFSTAWHPDVGSNRIFFCNGPESIMRNSLTQYLTMSLRSAEVRPEQTVDDSHPVDIKVTWNLKMERALIEIKWLGKSLNSDGKVTQNFTASRAKSGAKQLSDYLDGNKTQSPTHQTIGYLVVIDGRRRRTTADTTEINHNHGLYYQDLEIDYAPKFHEERPDFQPPIRMFAEPLCTKI